MYILLNNKEVFKDAIKELDQKPNPTLKEDDTEPILLPTPTTNSKEIKNHV